MEKKLTGYPSIDKPWLKYYSEEAINAPLPTGSMYDYMLHCNEKRLDAVALNYFGKKITHRQLQNNIDTCAKALTAYGVKPGDFISLCLLAIPETVYLLYAINKIGAVCNFLVLNSTEQALHKQIALSGSRIVITMDMTENKVVNAAVGTSVEKIITLALSESMPCYLSLLMKLKKGKTDNTSGTVRWKDFLKSGARIPLPENQTKNEDIAVIEYTGGTTGESKGVVLTNHAGNALAFHYRHAEKIFHFHAGERFLNILPPFLAYGLYLGIHMPLCVGTECILSPDPSPQTFPKLICQYKPNHFTGGALHLEHLMNFPAVQKLDLSFLITAAYGGDKSSKEWEMRTAAFFDQHNAPYGIVNGYGMTETAGACCTTSHELKHMIPFVKNNIKIIDVDNGKELQYGQEGEICVSGPTLMQGYYQNEKATSEAIWEENGIRWLHTGDLGYVTEDGHFVISGRLKRIYWTTDENNTIFRVYPMQIEATLNKHPLVHKCSVVGKPDDNKGFLSVAFIVLQKATCTEIVVSELKKLCEQELPETSWPYEYRIVDSLPTTGAGKVDYRALEREAVKER